MQMSPLDRTRIEKAVADCGFDLLPELTDIDAQILGILGVRRPPDGREHLLVGDDPSGVARKE